MKNQKIYFLLIFAILNSYYHNNDYVKKILDYKLPSTKATIMPNNITNLKANPIQNITTQNTENKKSTIRTFVANRLFLYLIRANKTNSILFMDVIC